MAGVIENMEVVANDLAIKSVDYALAGIKVVALFILGWIIGSIASGILQRILRTNKIKDTFTKYGAMTDGSWMEITKFLGLYVKLMILLLVLTLYDPIRIVMENFSIISTASGLLVFMILLIVGWIFAGLVYKIVREIVENIGMEKELKKHNLEDALGGIGIPHLVATLAKIYVFLVFVWQGVEQLGLKIFTGVMNSLMGYIPDAMLGLMVLIITLVVADFVGDRVKKREVRLAPVMALVAEAVIIIIGITLALPKFGFEDIDIIKYSFLILVLCMGIGLAIAMGFGLRDSFAKVGKKYEKELE